VLVTVTVAELASYPTNESPPPAKIARAQAVSKMKADFIGTQDTQLDRSKFNSYASRATDDSPVLSRRESASSFSL